MNERDNQWEKELKRIERTSNLVTTAVVTIVVIGLAVCVAMVLKWGLL